MMKFLLTTTALAGALVLHAPATNAALLLMVDGTTVADNGSGDLNPVINAITYSGGAANFNISVTTGIATSTPSIDLSNVLGQSTGAGTLVVKLTNTGLTSPVGLQSWLTQFSGNVSGGSATVQAQTFIDTSNIAFGMGTVLGSLTGTTSPFGLASANVGGGTTPYSLTEVVTITAGGAGRNFSLDTQLNLIGTQPSAIPEPATLGLLGVGLVGIGFVRRARGSRKA